MRIHHLRRCRNLRGRLFVLFGLFALLTGCPASPPESRPAPAEQSDDLSGQTRAPVERFTSEETVSEMRPEAPTPVPVTVPELPKTPLLPDEETLDENGLTSIEVAPFLFISDLRIDQLQHLIDAAPALQETWDQVFTPLAKKPTWVVFVIEKLEPFKKLNLLPRDDIPVHHGLQLENRVWIRVQETDYYTRHLFLHEATHARMMTASNFQGEGTLWFHEGVAEYLATHLVDSATSKIQLAAWPLVPNQLPGWNHFSKLQDANKKERTSTLPWVLAYQSDSYRRRDGQPYADSWALCQFLSRHPRYRDAFFRCLKSSNWETVLKDLTSALMNDSDARLEWLAWLATIGPKDDVIQPMNSEVVGTDSLLAPALIQTWMKAGGERGTSGVMEIHLEGRVKILVKGRDVLSGPDGVTIEYRHGFPVGAVLGSVADRDLKGQVRNPFSYPRIISGKVSLDISEKEALYLSINQFPQADAADQSGFQIHLSWE